MERLLLIENTITKSIGRFLNVGSYLSVINKNAKNFKITFLSVNPKK